MTNRANNGAAFGDTDGATPRGSLFLRGNNTGDPSAENGQGHGRRYNKGPGEATRLTPSGTAVAFPCPT